MKKILCLLTALCALLLISAVAENGFALDPARINEAAASVVILEQKNEEGNVVVRASGFASIEPGLVITSASFIQDAGEITATTDSGETLSVSGILGCNTDSDVAIIALTEKDKLVPLPIDTEKRVLRGSDCVVVGAQGENISVSIGNMSGFFEEEDISLIQFTAPLSVGSGGSPLFDENGNVAGITTGFYYDGTGVVQNLNFAVNITEALSLYDIVREDEVASFSEWEITDIGIGSFKNPELPLEFYIENQAYSNATEIYLFKQNSWSLGRSRINGGLKKGETATIRVSQEELESGEFWQIKISQAGISSMYDCTSLAYPISFLLGKTLVVTNYEGSADYREKLFMIKEEPIIQRRHLPEEMDVQSANKLPSNCIRIVNDTNMSIIEFFFANIAYSNLLFTNTLYSEHDAVIFVPSKFLEKLDTFILRTIFNETLSDARHNKYTYDCAVEPEEVLGKTMRFYVGEDGKVSFEIQ